jgi:hypothetical protein
MVTIKKLRHLTGFFTLLCVTNYVSGEPPRTVITGAVEITESGSYVLGNNIVINGFGGISVAASNVSIDLNGFTISYIGNDRFADGISVGGDFSNVEIYNGTITGFSRAGIWAGGFKAPGVNLKLHDLIINGNKFNAIRLEDRNGFMIYNCMLSNNGTAIDARGAGLINNNVITKNITGLSGVSIKTGYESNIITDNTIKDVSGNPTNLGHNLCTTGLCP